MKQSKKSVFPLRRQLGRYVQAVGRQFDWVLNIYGMFVRCTFDTQKESKSAYLPVIGSLIES